MKDPKHMRLRELVEAAFRLGQPRQPGMHEKLQALLAEADAREVRLHKQAGGGSDADPK